MKRLLMILLILSACFLLFGCEEEERPILDEISEKEAGTIDELLPEVFPESESEPETAPETSPEPETAPETVPATDAETEPETAPETQPETEKKTAADPPEEGKTVYLTFDDGPSKHTPRLLDILAKYGVKATFFVTGYGDPDYLTREHDEGHSVAVHSFSHDMYKIYRSEEAYFEDLDKMNGIIKEKTGEYSYLVRFPGGSSNTVSKYNPGIMTRLAKALEERGYVYFDWNASGQDAVTDPDGDVIFDNVVTSCKGKKDCVVLLHDSKGETVDVVERIINWGLERGYVFKRLTKDSPAVHHRISN